MSLGNALGRLILASGEGRWTGVRVGYNRETYLYLVTTWKVYLSCLNSSCLPWLARQAIFSSLGPHVRSGRPTNRLAVFWWAGPSCRDDHEPGRWGPRVTMSHKPPSDMQAQRPRGGHDEVLKPSTGRITCTSVQKRKVVSLAADLLVVS
jgi:hypothetical protein